MKNNIDKDSDIALHLQVRQRIQRQIAEMEIGDKLSPERILSKLYNVDRVTVRRALRDLTKEGFLVRQPGRGTFIRKQFQVSKTEDNKKSKTIALVMPSIEIISHAKILTGIEKELSRHDCQINYFNSLLDENREKTIIKTLRDTELDGVIIAPQPLNLQNNEYIDLILELKEEKQNIVFVDQYVPDLKIPVAKTDKVHLGYIAAEHLIMLGHKRIFYATTGRFDNAGSDTLRGYQMALQDYDIEFNEKLVFETPIRNSTEPVREAVKKLLMSDPQAFTAIASPCFSMTYGITQALKEMGRRVPDDIALIGGDVINNPELSYVTHTLQPFEKIGQSAARLLLNRLDDKTETQSYKQHILLEPELIMGETCGSAVLKEKLA